MVEEDISVLLDEKRVFKPKDEFVNQTNVKQWMDSHGIDNLEELHKKAENWEWFWEEISKELVEWYKPFDKIVEEPEKMPEVTIEKEEKETGPSQKAPGFAFMILSGYTILHTISYSQPVDTPIDLGHITADIVFLFPFNLGLRFTGASRHTFEDIYIQASGINFRGAFNSFLKVYTELGAGYPIPISPASQADPSVILIAQYGLIFDFKGISKGAIFALDLYAKGSFPINTILQGMTMDYGLKAGLRF